MSGTRIRAAALAAACLWGIAAPTAQQQPSQQPPAQAGPLTGMIAGRVVDSSNGQAIPNTTVNLLGIVSGRTALPRPLTTDSQGRFIFFGLAPGTYTVRTQRSGYTPTGTFVAERPVDLAADQKILDLIVRLHRQASIAGMVTDENADPVIGMGVTAFRRTLVNGHLVTLAANEIRTDDRGTFRLANLQPGDYFVCACRRDPMPLDGALLSTLAGDAAQLIGLATRALRVGADVASIDNVRTFGAAFYPSGALMSRATKITLADGDDRTGVDISVAIVRSARVSGRIVGAPGAVNAANIRLRLSGEMPEATPLIEPMLVQTDGRFDFVGVPPGSYVLNVSMPALLLSGGGPTGAALSLIGGRGTAFVAPPPNSPGRPFETQVPRWAQVPIVVGETDVTDVTVVLRDSARISIKAELPQMPPAQPAAPGQRVTPPVASYQLTPLPFDSRGLAPTGRVMPDGSGTLTGVGPGRYALRVFSAQGLQPSKVTLRGDDITDLPIEVGDADITDLVVTFSRSNLATLSGRVTGNFAETCVVIFPADSKFWAEPAAARRWFAAAIVSRLGTFDMGPSLPAGDYLIAAVSDREAEEFQQQSKLEALAARAQKISLTVGEVRTIEVKR